MFYTLFSLLGVLLPSAAAAWFIQPNVPDSPTVVPTDLACETPHKLSVYDEVALKTDIKDDTAFLHPYIPCFVPADMVELDIPLRVLSKQPLSTMELLERLLLANLKLRLLIQEYDDLQARAEKMLKSIAVPYFDTPGAGAMTVDDEKTIDHHKKDLENRLAGILRYGFAVHSTASSFAVSARLDSKSVSSRVVCLESFRRNRVPPLLEVSKSTREPAIKQENFIGQGVNDLSLARADEVKLPWIFRVVQAFLYYAVAHKIEVVFSGVLVILIGCFISLQAKA